MDIDMNLVLPVTVGAFAVCLCCLCFAIERGKRRATAKLERDRQEFIQNATKVQAEVQAEVVMSV